MVVFAVLKIVFRPLDRGEPRSDRTNIYVEWLIGRWYLIKFSGGTHVETGSDSVLVSKTKYILDITFSIRYVRLYYTCLKLQILSSFLSYLRAYSKCEHSL